MRSFCLLLTLITLCTLINAQSLESRRIAKWFETILQLPVGALNGGAHGVDGVVVQQLPPTTEADILAEIVANRKSSRPLKFSHDDGVQVRGGDDYPECGETVETTAEHLVEGTLDYFYNKICKDCKNDIVEKTCEYAEKHQEAFRGFVVGYTDPYSKAFFYAAGAGKCMEIVCRQHSGCHRPLTAVYLYTVTR